MVYLNKIYTRTGDAGETSLGDGTRVPKTSPRVIAYGNVDELNSVIGLTRTVGLPAEIDGDLQRIQNDLFDLGADLCVPEMDRQADAPQPLRVTPEQVVALEMCIDAANEQLEPLASFVLPGGSVAAAHLHHARAVCRRAEVALLNLMQVESVNPQTVVYLNRLSDLLFVLARLCNNNGKGDVLWIPGGQS